ncbi:hypothetical protein BC831DRAFT_434438 [Entophlyctis helioformis]|nr:hypothetical protein BC831DRAFT_434438 [Entophlyctis helioformis]
MASRSDLVVKLDASTARVPTANCHTIAGFVVAVKQAYTTALREVDASRISVHADLAGDALPGSTPLASLPPRLGTRNHPLVVRIAEDAITANDFLGCKPPTVHFSEEVSRKRPRTSQDSTPRSNPKNPRIVADWEGFTDAAASFQLEHSAAIRPPVFMDDTFVEDEKSLEAVILDNILKKMNSLLRHCGSPFVFSVFSLIDDGMVGRPDHVLRSGGTLMSFLEIKTVWDVPTPHGSESIGGWWRDGGSPKQSSIVNTVVQVYGYLAHNSLKYGMLTNGEVFWFLSRPNHPGHRSQLLVSPPVWITGDNPTLFRALFYFISLVEQGHISDMSPTTNVSLSDATPPPASDGIAQGSDGDADQYALPADLDLGQHGALLGSGTSGEVFEYQTTSGQVLALKCCDVNNNTDGYEMILNEVDIYRRLSPLQGDCIPRLHFYGHCDGIFVLATTKISGTAVEPLPDDIVASFKGKLAQYGVEHGDYRPDNVLVDDDGKHWLIDFGMSAVSG